MGGLQLAGDDAARLSAAIEVVGAESTPVCERPCVTMPKTPARPLAEQDGPAGPGILTLPLPNDFEPKGSLTAKVMRELRRDRTLPHPALACIEFCPSGSPRGCDDDRTTSDAAEEAVDPCLARLIAVWPQLPQKVRDAITAIVNSTGRE